MRASKLEVARSVDASDMPVAKDEMRLRVAATLMLEEQGRRRIPRSALAQLFDPLGKPHALGCGANGGRKKGPVSIGRLAQ